MPDHGLQTLDEIVLHYRAGHQDRSERELRWFVIQPSLEETVRRAAAASGPGGKRLKHQRRVTQQALAELGKLLLSLLEQLEAQPDFEQLHALLEDKARPIPGIGELTVYDTALRIGAKLGLSPKKVFLHAGTRKGARAIGLHSRAAAVNLTQLPGPLATLDAREAEDVLCIYKDDLARLMGAPHN